MPPRERTLLGVWSVRWNFREIWHFSKIRREFYIFPAKYVVLYSYLWGCGSLMPRWWHFVQSPPPPPVPPRTPVSITVSTWTWVDRLLAWLGVSSCSRRQSLEKMMSKHWRKHFVHFLGYPDEANVAVRITWPLCASWSLPIRANQTVL